MDRLTWQAQISAVGRAAFLLDPDYRADLLTDDLAVKQALDSLAEVVRRHPASAGRANIDALLTALGDRGHH